MPNRFVSSNKLERYDVIDKDGDDMGQVQTFVVDMQEGRIAFALVAFGGILGISDKWFALPWAALEWRPDKAKFVVDMDDSVLKNVPGMKKDKWIEEIEKWKQEKDLEPVDRYFTTHGYESYKGIIQEIKGQGKKKPDAKFEINKDKAGQFRFNLVALNGEIIASSESYESKSGAMDGIESIRKNAPIAVIEDNTAAKK